MLRSTRIGVIGRFPKNSLIRRSNDRLGARPFNMKRAIIGCTNVRRYFRYLAGRWSILF